ncbi:hypothetical protein [Hymenobacter latericus]|uniref:hypothetical protein n=1 Tax=Hymenobacter sp. YIM 151858-1 TaxID=2987688 RepID=UPI0022272483|nr:hypothetical protein [Hymenobacter sp. YIM 151858-1]UYZ61151.1 hypothetical protein OIS50_19470 [Hymenobacter sp. YIM 151858-1]
MTRHLVLPLLLGLLGVSCGEQSPMEKRVGINDEQPAILNELKARLDTLPVEERPHYEKLLDAMEVWYNGKRVNEIKFDPRAEQAFRAHLDILHLKNAKLRQYQRSSVLDKSDLASVNGKFDKHVSASFGNLQKLLMLPENAPGVDPTTQRRLIVEVKRDQVNRLSIVAGLTRDVDRRISKSSQQSFKSGFRADY